MRRRLILSALLTILTLVTMLVSALIVKGRMPEFELTTATPTPPIAVITGNVVQVRTGPGIQFQIVGELTNTRTRIFGVDTSGEWYLVQFGGGTGWVNVAEVIYDGSRFMIPEVTYVSPTPFITRTVSPTFSNAGQSPTAPLPSFTPSPTIINPTYISASQSPTAPIYVTYPPSPTPYRLYPTLTLPSVQLTSLPIGRVAIVLEPNAGCCRLITNEELQLTAQIIRQRLQNSYLSELNVIAVDGRIYVELVDTNGNIDSLLGLMQQQGAVEIVNLSGISLEQRQALIGQPVLTTAYDRFNGDAFTNPLTGAPFQTVLTINSPVFSGAYGMEGRWIVDLTLSYENSEQLLAYTSANIGQMMGIVVDGVLISAPLIERQLVNINLISDVGSGFYDMEAMRLAQILPYGALPFPLTIIEINPMN